MSLTGPAPLVHVGARDADGTLFVTPDPLAALPGTPDASNSYAAHGNSPTTVWDFSGLRPNYGDDGSRFGMVGTILQTASMVPGVDTFADGALCALELGAAIGGNGNTASLAMSCAAVVLPAVGAGAMALTSRAYKGVTEIRKARKAARFAEEVLEEGLEHGDEAAAMLGRGGSYLDRFRSPRGAASLGGAPSPSLSASDLTGKTRTEIRALADDRGLVAHGLPDPADGLPRKWKDPVTNEQRLRLDRGHVDANTGLPYDLPSASVDHCHGYTCGGSPIRDGSGDPHFPTTGD